MSRRINETTEQAELGNVYINISKWWWTGMHEKVLGKSLPGVEFWRIQDPTLGTIHLRLIGYRWIAARGWGAEIDQILERHANESQSQKANRQDQSRDEIPSEG